MSTRPSADDERFVWREDRRRELLEILWDWDPLGISGVAEFYYYGLAASVLVEISDAVALDGLNQLLRREVRRLAAEGWSKTAGERSTTPGALAEIVGIISAWWATTPPRP